MRANIFHVTLNCEFFVLFCFVHKINFLSSFVAHVGQHGDSNNSSNSDSSNNISPKWQYKMAATCGKDFVTAARPKSQKAKKRALIFISCVISVLVVAVVVDVAVVFDVAAAMHNVLFAFSHFRLFFSCCC